MKVKKKINRFCDVYFVFVFMSNKWRKAVFDA